MADKKIAKTVRSVKKTKVVAKAISAAKTDKTNGSVIACEVKLESGVWVRPSSCEVFHLSQDAELPDVVYEIKCEDPGPYEWSWEISWVVMACPQAKGKSRFKAKSAKIFKKSGQFVSQEKTWRLSFDGQVLGGDLTVKVKTARETFVRKNFVRGREPGKEKVHAVLDRYQDKVLVSLAKKIFNQETKNNHFYSDEMPLVSFDNGYGLGQLTNPEPAYEQAWSWLAHVKQVMDVALPTVHKRAKNYLGQHSGYTAEMLDLETLAAYNGWGRQQHYHSWDEKAKQWVVNGDVLCDPGQSNKGWLMTDKSSKGKTLAELSSDKNAIPFYTGRCYAEHIKNAQ